MSNDVERARAYRERAKSLRSFKSGLPTKVAKDLDEMADYYERMASQLEGNLPARHPVN